VRGVSAAMKLLMKILFVIPAGALMLWAATHVDYSHSTNFDNYHTYSWLKVGAPNSLWQDRIQRAVDAQLAAKGWMLAPSGGDAAIAAVGAAKDEQQLNTFYDGMGGGWYWRGGGGMATTTVETIPVGSLDVDIFDAQTKKLIWRGTAEKTLSGNPEKNEKKLQDAVKDMFKKFPPVAKG